MTTTVDEKLKLADKLAREFCADPDKRAQVKVQLAMLAGPQIADMIDEAVTVSRAYLSLRGAESAESRLSTLASEAESHLLRANQEQGKRIAAETRVAALEKDAERLDFVQSQAKGYGRGWIFRQSLNRGMRLHETSLDGAYPTAREAIDAYAAALAQAERKDG